MLKKDSTVQIKEITSYEKLTRCKAQIFGINKEGAEYEECELFLAFVDTAHEFAADLNVNDFVKIKDFGVSRNKQYTNIYVFDAEKVEGRVVVDDSEDLPFS